MATYLLDTSILIDVLNDKKNRPAEVKLLSVQGHTLASCPITIAEVFAGMRPNESGATEAFLSLLEYHDITYEIAQLAGHLKFSWARRGRTITLADALIAATAISDGLVLVTENVRDFPMPELSIHPLKAKN